MIGLLVDRVDRNLIAKPNYEIRNGSAHIFTNPPHKLGDIKRSRRILLPQLTTDMKGRPIYLYDIVSFLSDKGNTHYLVMDYSTDYEGRDAYYYSVDHLYLRKPCSFSFEKKLGTWDKKRPAGTIKNIGKRHKNAFIDNKFKDYSINYGDLNQELHKVIGLIYQELDK